MVRLRLRHLVAAALVVVVLGGCGRAGKPETSPAAAGGALAPKSCGRLEHGGGGVPAGTIVSDLPMRGASAERSRQQVEAIRLVLEQRHWMAGSTPIAFRACDDSIARTGLWDAAVCRSNAEAYAADPRVLGVIGTYNSGCAAEEIPILNRAGIVMISPGNTAVCLTEPAPTCQGGQPASLYPTGRRTYARVVPNDAFQGAALADFARRKGVTRPYVLYAADDPTSTGQAMTFRGAAKALDLKLAGYQAWDPKARNYRGLFAKVRSARANGVVLAGLIEQNGVQLIRDKVTVGSNQALPMIAFDGFAQQSTIDGGGAAARGMFASVPGTAPRSLSGQGGKLVQALTKRLEGRPVEQFAPYAGEAAAVLLDAIAKAGPRRAGVVGAVFTIRGGGGILDRYDMRVSGDPSVGPITVLRAGASFGRYLEIRSQPRLVRAARG
ncbi:MAG: branched-chain amino acid ABC transporter substrate-binding protein [Solirubrobacteraceae bacterium]